MTKATVAGALGALILLSGCAQGPLSGLRSADPVTPAAALPEAPPPAPIPKPAARTVEEFDATTAAQRATAAAKPAPGAETRLGTTVASLGNPAEPGFWLRTPLARAEAPGRIEHPATGASAQVTLLPMPGAAAGAGSQISLPALRLLGLPLTALPELVVYAR
ncbi:hypothetical protein [Phaeovulum sp. NW3]|uniref:hypothetical protein n=1 Tax=Phaeovulum sp. NW3 TaxID=2934933 RepID=UPI0020211AE4|nr:hypothetical protein [Phaeovulum sp. NW3]MCL7465799.1 hypothetical protein [Phaeovulum sp. NW3]